MKRKQRFPIKNPYVMYLWINGLSLSKVRQELCGSKNYIFRTITQLKQIYRGLRFKFK